jgi:hypothetical protein
MGLPVLGPHVNRSILAQHFSDSLYDTCIQIHIDNISHIRICLIHAPPLRFSFLFPSPALAIPLFSSPSTFSFLYFFFSFSSFSSFLLFSSPSYFFQFTVFLSLLILFHPFPLVLCFSSSPLCSLPLIGFISLFSFPLLFPFFPSTFLSNPSPVFL